MLARFMLARLMLANEPMRIRSTIAIAGHVALRLGTFLSTGQSAFGERLCRI